MVDLPVVTLFMLMSVDGKISTGVSDNRDFDKDLPNVAGAVEGLEQYYNLEKETDSFSLNSGKVMAKVGWNAAIESIEKLPVTFVVVDNQPHLTVQGLKNLQARGQKIILVTTNSTHPAKKLSDPSMQIIEYQKRVDFKDLFSRLKKVGAKNLTVQSGGKINSELIRLGLINYLSIVVAPIIVGGSETPTLVDGFSLETAKDLSEIKSLKLLESTKLQNNYLHLKYEVLNYSARKDSA